ncbi:probable N-acetyltransferase CML1 [Protopterus annectens]|uniref:probable N-acetyltransferase CML1 n=1 Tax=Protopterus annectens TaxID=7888 RepID=UPI001CF976C5|nr:probable N-acetyltransferase CML1 [Protopterus annectens]
MADYQIRKYQNSDYEVARDIFVAGMNEYISAAFLHVTRQWWNLVVLLTVIFLLFLTSGSFFMATLGMVFALGGERLCFTYAWRRYIDQTLKADLQDIQRSYMEGDVSCFWVVECSGDIIGTVAARPAAETLNELELKRMSVRRAWRGRGIAKALCRTVIDFARQKGYKAVVLNVTFVQHEAQQLYEGLGFLKCQEYFAQTVFGKWSNFRVFKYRYSILGNS